MTWPSDIWQNRLLCVLSHETASSSAWCSNHKPPENRVIEQWLTIWSIVCCGFPHMHDGSEAWCHRTRLAAHRPWPVRYLLNVDHRRRGRLKPGGQMVETVTSDWLTTVILNHASIHSDAAVASGAGLFNVYTFDKECTVSSPSSQLYLKLHMAISLYSFLCTLPLSSNHRAWYHTSLPSIFHFHTFLPKVKFSNNFFLAWCSNQKDHVTNEELMRRSGMQALSEIVQTRRLRLAGHVLRLPDVRPARVLHDLNTRI